MKIITQGAEHHFLVFVDKLKNNPNGWVACTFGFSKKLVHEDLVARRAFIAQTLNRVRKDSTDFLAEIQSNAQALPNAHVFQFADNDIILLCCPHNDSEQKVVRDILEKMTKKLPDIACDYGFLIKELSVFQKVADYKLLQKKKIEAYAAIGEQGLVDSIDIRRKRRDEPVILVVEDDRFTATYIHSFLKEFDVVIARTGEDALLKYLEYAPDAVFLDIHLPGINGHQTLQGIKAADPEAFVVVLSVDTAQNSIINASEHGAISYLKKPFSRERVMNTLRLSPFIRDSRGILPIERQERV